MTATVAIPQRTRHHHGARPRPLRTASAATFRRRRRAASVALAATLSVVGLAANAVLTDSSGGVPASAAAGVGTAPTRSTVRAEAGDSLWSIAEAHRGDVSIRRYVDALVDLNGGSTEIEAGQVVTLP